MIRKTAFLVTGTVTGLVAVLSYNPPKLDSAIAASGTATLPTTTDNTNSNTANSTASSSPSAASATSPAQPVKPVQSATAKTNSKPTSTTNEQNSSSNKASTSTANTEQSATPASPSASPIATQKQSSGSSGTFKGETVRTRWGPVQVQITVSNGKISDISTLQYPNGDRRSMMISSQVIPWLQQEALQAQSANISGIGGATYTSGGFINSLASALQKAGL